MKKGHIDHISRIALLALLVAAFAWRVQGLTNQSLWRDEVDAIYFALRQLQLTLSMFTDPAQNGPLYFLTLRPWFHLVGASEFALRYPSALAGTLSIPLCYQVARRLTVGTGQRLAPTAVEQLQPDTPNLPLANYHLPHSFVPLLAATLLAFNPYQLWYGQEGKMYAIIICLTLLANWFWLNGITQGGWRPWVAYLVTVSLAIYTHLLMVLLLPFHLVWFLIAWPQSRYHWRGYGLALAGLTLPYLPMVWWQWAMLTSTEARTGFTFTPLRQVLHSLLLNHSRGFLPSDDLLPLTPIFFLGLAGLVLGWGEIGKAQAASERQLSTGRRFLLIVSWLFGPILAIHALSLRQAIFTERYIIWLAPALMILLALGAQVVWHNAGILSKLLTVLLVAYILSFWLYVGWQQKTMSMKYDLRGAVTYISTRRDPATLLILQIPHMEYSYRYYSSDFSRDWLADSDARLGWWTGGLWTNGGAPDDRARSEVAAQMQQITAGADELWVMRSEVEMWDARHLMEEWLDQHGTVIDQAEFHGAQVRHYQLKRGE